VSEGTFGKLYHEHDNDLIQVAFKFFAEELDISGEKQVSLKVVDNIGRGDMAGFCMPVFNKDESIKEMKITIKRYPVVLGMIEALAHEMVHAKQYIKGELTTEVKWRWFLFIPYLSIRHYFNGKRVDNLPYWDRPYEQEAFIKQKELTRRFLNYVIDQVPAYKILYDYLETI
jgi:hypothetical protein